MALVQSLMQARQGRGGGAARAAAAAVRLTRRGRPSTDSTPCVGGAPTPRSTLHVCSLCIALLMAAFCQAHLAPPHTPKCLQGRWYDCSSLLTLPHLSEAGAARLAAAGLPRLPQLLQALSGGGAQRHAAVAALEAAVGGQREARDVLAVCERLPVVGVAWRVVHKQQHQQQHQQSRADGDGPSSGGGSGADASSYVLEVELARLAGKGAGRQSPPRVYAPRFPKASSRTVAGVTPTTPWGLRRCPRLPACLPARRASVSCIVPAVLHPRSHPRLLQHTACRPLVEASSPDPLLSGQCLAVPLAGANPAPCNSLCLRRSRRRGGGWWLGTPAAATCTRSNASPLGSAPQRGEYSTS